MRRAIASEQAPKAVGPYSQAIESGEMVFFSGQIALDPATGELVPGGTEAECRQVLANLGHVLAAAGLDYGDVVKTTIFLVDLGDFVAVNRIYGGVFTAPHPARSTIGVASLPKGARIEIEAIAMRSA